MRLIEGERGRLYLEIEHGERAPLYLMLANSWLQRDKVDRVDREFPAARAAMQRVLDQLKRYMS